MAVLALLVRLQWFFVNVTQRIFHHSVPRYTAFKFEELTNLPNLTKSDSYWQGPVNFGLFHFFPVALSTAIMFVFMTISLVLRTPSNKCVCCCKFIIFIVGLLIFIQGFFEFYGHVGIVQLWKTRPWKKWLRKQIETVCVWFNVTADTVTWNALAADVVKVHEKAMKVVPLDPDYKDGNKSIQKALKRFNTHIQRFISNNKQLSSSQHLNNSQIQFGSLCNAKDMKLWVGEWELFDTVDWICVTYVPVGVLLSIFTIILGYFIIRTMWNKSKWCFTIILGISSFTSIAWWVMSGIPVVLLVGLADFNLRGEEAVHLLLSKYNNNITLEIVSHFMKCSQPGSTHNFKSGLGNLVTAAHFIQRSYNGVSYAYNDPAAFDSLPSTFKNDASNSDPLKAFIAHVNKIYKYSVSLQSLNGTCGYYDVAYEEEIGKGLCRYFYWTLLVSYLSAISLGIFLMIFVLLGLRIRGKSGIICCRRTHPEDEEIKCKDTCPRRPNIELKLSLRRECPPACLGLPKEFLEKCRNVIE